jgi:hypothetical protein
MILISKTEPFVKIAKINYDHNKSYMIFRNGMDSGLKLLIGDFIFI